MEKKSFIFFQVDETETGKGFKKYDFKCTIIGVAQIKLGNGKILKANASGEISFDGGRDCEYGGTFLCEPVSCRDLYEVIFN